jgi:signal transduction histidine kinase
MSLPLALMAGFNSDELLGIHRREFDKKMLTISHLRKPYQVTVGHEEPLMIQIVNTEESPPDQSTDVCNLGLNFKAQVPPYRTLRLTKYNLSHSTTPTIMYFRDMTLETEMDRMKSEFLSIAAHELRMPIASMYGYCELLLNREFDDLTKRDILQAIYGQCSGIVEMINDLLDLARIETGSKKFFHFESLSFVELVKTTLSGLKLQSDSHKMEVHYFVDETALVYGDNDQIKRAILNILSNAFKYSPSNRKVLLEIKQRTNKNNVQELGLSVQDKGIGMKPEQVARIFERFWRADNVRDVVGTGLGMALVKEIMDLHNGDIEVQSILGEGTTISLWLPVNQSENK